MIAADRKKGLTISRNDYILIIEKYCPKEAGSGE